MRIIKPLANVISLTTANTVNNGTVILVTSGTGAALLTVANASVTRGTLVIPPNQYMFVEKLNTDTIAANVAVSATSIAYRG